MAGKDKKVKIVDEKPKAPGKIRPVLSADVQDHFEKRAARKKKQPNFRRQEWFRYKRLGTKWRKPKGLHSKARTNLKYRAPNVRVGYGSPAKARGLHPSGFREVLVYNPNDLESLDPTVNAARIAHGVGTRKRMDIVKRAEKLKIHVLNGGV
ncbi:MAG: 50S ribosomal protein L32e [Thermoplasmata archaeon]|nr:50S ribosomal protein L32e [Thermoplasmata archaeon]